MRANYGGYRSGRRSRDRIYNAITELMQELGEMPSMRQIARKTGLSVSTVHYHMNTEEFKQRFRMYA